MIYHDVKKASFRGFFCYNSLMTVTSYDPKQASINPDIELTDAAASKIKDLISEENKPDLHLRVFISGGGCSGFQYGFTFDETPQEGDQTIAKDDVEVWIDPISLQYLSGAEIDYKEDYTGEQFIIHNPNAVTTCSCGSSFGI